MDGRVDGGVDGRGDRAVWTRVSAGRDQPLDLLAARFVHHRFAPHAHEEFSIGVCTAGVEFLDYRGDRWYARPGSVVILEPDEVHTGSPAIPDGFSYRVMYPATALVAESGLAKPHFPNPIVYDPQLADALRRTHVELTEGSDPLAAESRLTWNLATMLHRHAVRRGSVAGADGAGAAPGERVARAAMDRLADQLLDPPSLQDIAAELGLSRFQLLRAFRASVGLPPYAWLAQYRVNRARCLLAEGYRPAQAAALVGFADQAHLNRWFRRVVGVTPGSFRNSVQDSIARLPRS
ncbi:MAG TPA: AraC family transcriptional regulator [Pseudonocardiaceae bacterium]|nr:AraC family transcriptional regulator [Pseudonocardiaceae bacterium]